MQVRVKHAQPIRPAVLGVTIELTAEEARLFRHYECLNPAAGRCDVGSHNVSQLFREISRGLQDQGVCI